MSEERDATVTVSSRDQVRQMGRRDGRFLLRNGIGEIDCELPSIAPRRVSWPIFDAHQHLADGIGYGHAARTIERNRHVVADRRPKAVEERAAHARPDVG